MGLFSLHRDTCYVIIHALGWVCFSQVSVYIYIYIFLGTKNQSSNRNDTVVWVCVPTRTPLSEVQPSATTVLHRDFIIARILAVSPPYGFPQHPPWGKCKRFAGLLRRIPHSQI